MANWSPQDWVLIIGALFTGLTGLATVVLQLLGNKKTSDAKAISVDNNDKLSAVVHQTNELARVTPEASTAPTDAVIQKGS